MDRRDVGLLALAGAVGLATAATFDWRLPPYEDAAMLMRYAQHLAAGHGIVWNVGDPPVDGATDFLFLVLLAGTVKLGVGLTTATRALALLAHILTVGVIYSTVRRVHGAGRWPAFLSAAAFAAGPGIGHAAAYFGTPVFVFCAALSWQYAARLAADPSPRPAAGFALSCLAGALVRPEGVFLGLFMLAAVVYRRGWRESRAVVLWFVGAFALLGGAYFAWRWHYFGHPLPNPFYRKGGGRLHKHGLVTSTKNALLLAAPWLWAVIAGWRASARKETIFALIPVVLFTGLWVLLANDMNYLMRFQSPLLPIILMAWPRLVRDLAGEWRPPPDHRRLVNGVLVLAAVAVPVYWQVVFRLTYDEVFPHRRDGRQDVALLLAPYADRGYTMAVSEAGLLPLLSGWRAIDTWGLNDAEIAHRGALTTDYLDRQRPRLILFNAFFSPLLDRDNDDPWMVMTRTLKRYAETHGFHLAAAFGETPYQAHYYYIDPTLPEAEAIITGIRRLDYRWYRTGQPVLDLSAFAR